MTPHDANPGFFCDLSTLQASERQRRRELADALGDAARKRTELPTGYALEFDARRITITAISEWIALEKRCCPFLNFSLRADPLSEALTVELTGAEGVKEFLRTEFMR